MTIETKVDPMPNIISMPNIIMEQHEWELLASILRVHLPEHKVWAFGSRATGQRAKRFSDLDLAVEGEPLTMTQSATLSNALVESDLPFKVDVVELSALMPEFRARIESSLVLIQE